MANEEQLSILKQGSEVWNKWRAGHPHDFPILNAAKLSSMDLWKVDLSDAQIMGTDLKGANLGRSTLRDAMALGSNFEKAYMAGADLRRSNFMGANFCEADLTEADLSSTILSRANLSGAVFGKTTIAFTDLADAKGLENIRHSFPSSISFETIRSARTPFPELFLRGCGLSDVEIEYCKLLNPTLGNNEINKILYKIYDLRATQALQISPLFISYSHGDNKFVNKLELQLNAKGIRFWRDIHEMKAGRLEYQIDRAISQNPTVLLVLSENSLRSDWVEHEVRSARGLEKNMGRDVLCPVALDDSWKSSPWPARVMEQIMEYNILDFSAWEDDVKFEGMFRKLIDGLELFYKDKSHGE